MRQMGKRKLDDDALRTRLLDMIRSGLGRYAATQHVGLHPNTFQAYYRDVPSFRDEVDAAEAGSVEPILHMLRDEALAGDITAAKEYMKHVAPPPKGESQTQKVEVEHVHQLDPAQIQDIAELQARLRDRPALPSEVIDVEEIDE